METGLFATVQAPVNAVERQFIPVLQAAKERNMGTIAMKPLAGGSFMHPELALRQLLAEPLLDVVIPGEMCIRDSRRALPWSDQESCRIPCQTLNIIHSSYYFTPFINVTNGFI